ncbi:MAG: DUF6379 domain-containing protein [Sphingomonas sp.]|uniref:C-glycoside deglycosidase beta subunit domain-containing protein n=1 Tax=Sphingomonas sp. TaxID=28214 RepID=UPI002635F1DC|nr:DUF6379 domain-containing protein [Sphingomonas sp.]MDK2766205.1 DUF6379 domain-containing protein [Sphingomonas sp.]
MFDKYLIVDGSLRNVGPADAPSGFAFEAKLGYYRGLGLSMVEALDVTVDGEPIPRDAVRFDEGNGPLSLDEMETAFDRRWPFGASATITVARNGGLAPGEHRLEFAQRLRVSYMPFPSVNSDAKTLTVA